MMTDIELLDNVTSEQDIIDYLEDMGYKVFGPCDTSGSLFSEEYFDSLSDNDILKVFKMILKRIKPCGYISKEEAKTMIIDYIEFNF